MEASSPCLTHTTEYSAPTGTRTWCRSTRISRSFECPDRRARRASKELVEDAKLEDQICGGSGLVSTHGRVLGIHRHGPLHRSTTRAAAYETALRDAGNPDYLVELIAQVGHTMQTRTTKCSTGSTTSERYLDLLDEWIETLQADVSTNNSAPGDVTRRVRDSVISVVFGGGPGVACQDDEHHAKH